MKKELVFGALVMTAIAGMNIQTVVADDAAHTEKENSCKGKNGCEGKECKGKDGKDKKECKEHHKKGNHEKHEEKKAE